MGWPYAFVSLDDEEKRLRSVLLARYGVYAQLSTLVPILLYQLFCLASWVHAERRRSRVEYTQAPTSPVAKRRTSSWPGVLVIRWRSLCWWLDGEAYSGWGTRGHLIGAFLWTIWLLFLCVHRTGDDYFHVTKRFGIVAASQFPIHYLLALKSRYSPLALLLRTSHEHLNVFHRLSGRIIHLLLLLHGAFYLNVYYQNGFLPGRLLNRVPFVGTLSLVLMSILALTSFAAVRRWSYRVFFILHLTIGIAIVPLLWFHHRRMRLYLAEALAVFVVDISVRKLETVTAPASIDPVPATSLVKLKLPLPPSKIAKFKDAAGQHVYLSLPAGSAAIKGLKGRDAWKFNFFYNPFTVADVSSTDITLVLRVARGPMTKTIYKMAQSSETKWPINVDGPFGMSRFFPKLATKFDRILLIAGGVGATFTLPLYKEIVSQMVKEGISSNRVQFVWAVKNIEETSWALGTESRSLLKDEGIRVYITSIDRDPVDHRAHVPTEEDELELDELQEESSLISSERKRPNFEKIIDRAFAQGQGEHVAILVCGPAGMGQDVRKHITKWITRGREVWFHDETFGW